ncbi:MAG TPA: GGDEF domain-containing protein [Nocardioides sp.]|uniref:GGDEF domain-containing protein n=1 Tax=Nocardioides sp. TaxID=35761 RepID=UPI002ED8EF13
MDPAADPAADPAGTGRRAWVALAGGCAIVALFALTLGTAAGSVTYLLGAGYGVALSIVGARRMPRPLRRAWVAFAVAQVLFLTADVIRTVLRHTWDDVPFPTVADAFYLAQYVALAFGLVWLVRGRRDGRDRAAFLDAAILTTGVSVVGIIFFVAPAATAASSTILSQVVAAAYPAGDLLIVAVVFRMLIAGMVRNVALWALLTALGGVLAVDLYYVVSIVGGTAYPAWTDCIYLLSYQLLGFAALHPSARTLSEPAPDRAARINAARLSWLGVALVLAPVADQVAHVTGFQRQSWVVLAGACISAVLVVLRLTDVLNDLQYTAVQLDALARKDGLTGVANRRTWDHELLRACAFARDQRTSLSVAVLDIDHFKEFNDTHGHLAGDRVLQDTTAAWTSTLPDTGFLARYGGEEFAVLLPQLPPREVRAVLERMRQAVTHGQTCSIGVATWDGAESPAEVVSRADQALYLAKRSGRDRVVVHEDGPEGMAPPPGAAASARATP